MAGETRERMVRSAAVLLRSHGVHGTSVARVLADSHSPRGSVAHHFPGGKDELLLAAVAVAGDEITGRLRRLAQGGLGVTGIVDALCDHFAEGLVRTGYRAGCPVAAVAQEGFGSDPLRDAASEVLDDWHDILSAALLAEGASAADAFDIAATCIAAVEGAILMCRARRDRAPLDAVARRLRLMTSSHAT